jgi:DNA repair photolyase
MNICTQRCEYCYAKTWKKCEEPLDKVVNDILRKKQQKEGLIPFLLRKKMPISMSNRTDLLAAPDWRERLSAIKRIGNPIYLETKLNKDYKDLLEILDPATDEIYQTVTGFNNKHEEHNLLSAEEKIEAAKWLNEKGFKHTLAINPFLPDKVTVEEIKQMIDIVKPWGVVMRDYHTTSKSLDKHLFMPEFPKEICDKAREEVRQYCKEKKILHDIDGFEDNPYPELNLRLAENEHICQGMGFVWQEFLIAVYEQLKNDDDIINITFDDLLEFYAPQIDFFKDCIFKSSDYAVTAGKSNFKWANSRFGIVEFLNGMWNQNKLYSVFAQWSNTKDEKGNLIYCRSKKFYKDQH